MYVLHPVSAAEVLNFLQGLYGGAGVYEVGGAELDCRCAGHQELQGIMAVHYSAQSDNRYGDCLGHLPDHTHCYRAYTGSGQAACDSTQYRLHALHIHCHSQECICKGNSIGAGGLGCTRYLCDVCDIR